MPTESATLAAKAFLASQLSASGHVSSAYVTVSPLFRSDVDGWRFLVGLFSIMWPSINAYRDDEGNLPPEVSFGSSAGQATPGDAVLGRIATPFFHSDRSTARARWQAAFDSGLAPDVLGSAVIGAGVCLALRFATPPTP